MKKEHVSDKASEETLLLRARASDMDALTALILTYQKRAQSMVRGYHVAGLDDEDLRQEALTGFIKAVWSYRSTSGVPFRAYATICMRRQLQTVVRAGLAGKQQPLRDYVSLEDSSALSLMEHDCADSPETIVIKSEEVRLRAEKMRTLLSALEQEALSLYLNGSSYEEMSRKMNTTPKAVDNALQRVRRKLRSIKL